MKRIFKRLIAVLCICTMLLSISGCVSTANTNNAKSLSANSSYNIDEYEEESVKIDFNTGMSFSEKGSVRFEPRGGIELVDFWEYGDDKNDTLYFNGLDKDGFENNLFYGSDIECAYEYKNMIYFLRRIYDKKKAIFYRTLYRMTLKGEDLTKITTIIQENDMKYNDWYVNDYELKEAYVQNNTLILRICYYYDPYGDDNDWEYSDIYKVDLKTGITQKLLKTQKNIELVAVKCDNDFTYLYLNRLDYEYNNENPEVYKIDNKTNKSSVVKYNFGNVSRYKLCAVYNGMLICEKNSVVSLISTNKKPKTVYDGNSVNEISYIFLCDSEVIIKFDNSSYYSYNLETGKLIDNELSNDMSRAVYKLGDKYLCFIEDGLSEDEYFDRLDEVWGIDGYQCYYLSSVEDVNENKHNFEKIKNQPTMSYHYEYYPYVSDEYEFDYDEYQQ